MFNGYNETALISYEFSQERVEKKSDNVPKWSYGHEPGPQPAQANRSGDFWPGKGNYLGVPNMVKCNCTGYYPTSECQSYQGDNTRHRPWLPRSFPVPLNGSNDSCKLPPYQWEGLSNQNTCYTDGNIPYVPENGEKYPYYRHYQNPKLTEVNQPGVITSVKDVEYGKKAKDLQNGRQTVYTAGYKRNCDPYAVDQHLPRLSIEPFSKAVPSNLSQNQVPSTGYRSVKENPYNTGYDMRKTCSDSGINQLHMDYSHFTDIEPKLCFDNTRHLDYYSRNYPDLLKRSQTLENRKDCAMIGQTTSEIHYNPTRYKPYETFDKPESDYANCFQDGKTDNMNVHARLPRSAMLFNDPRSQNLPSYQNNQTGYKDVSYQGGYEYPGGFQRTETNQYRSCQQLPSCEFAPPSGGLMFNQQKPQDYCSPVHSDPLISENPKPNFLEAIRSEEIKNGTSKISPLRLLRKKKFINVPQEPSGTSLDTPPGLDVRKFWSTWAEEEEENVAPTEMVVLDCQNIDPEQAKLLHLYDDPGRAVPLENIVVKTPKETEETKTSEVETVPEPMSSMKKLSKKGTNEKKKKETIDKWTEKKLDFLKRAEESKAAEILRHEEEKKKIFETRLSLQQSLKKLEKPLTLETNVPESVPQKSQNNSPETEPTRELPTCEYRRNKFLDYSDRKLVPENVPDSKVKEEVFEMDDILQKMSEINVESPEVKLETESDDKKSKRKSKKKKPEPEGDKLTVETVAKPTIKFSIQKSHDLKISFKVLNSKENETEENAEDKNTIEESTNSTEMITLKYKSIQREGDRRPTSEKKKSKKGFRRKKLNDMKTPVLKIKKSRYMPEEEKDPLAQNDEEPMKPDFNSSDDFQVQETVDSAKIKLTFKRHKGTFETECKVNSGNVDDVGEDIDEDSDPTERIRKKSKRPKEGGIEPFSSSNDIVQDEPNITQDLEDPLFPEFNTERDSTNETVTSKELKEREDDDDDDDEEEEGEGEKEEEQDQVETTEGNEYSNGNSENVREISLDFIKSTKSPEIETNHKTRKTEENSNSDARIVENSQIEKSPDWKENLGCGNDVGLSLLDFDDQNCDVDKTSLPSHEIGNDFSPENTILDELGVGLGTHDSIASNGGKRKNSKLELSDFDKNDAEDRLSVDLSMDSSKVELCCFEKELPVDLNANVSLNRDDSFEDLNKELRDFGKDRLIPSLDPLRAELNETFRDLTGGFEKESISQDLSVDLSLDNETMREDSGEGEANCFERELTVEGGATADVLIDSLDEKIMIVNPSDVYRAEKPKHSNDRLIPGMSEDPGIDESTIADPSELDLSSVKKEMARENDLSIDSSIDFTNEASEKDKLVGNITADMSKDLSNSEAVESDSNEMESNTCDVSIDSLNNELESPGIEKKENLNIFADVAIEPIGGIVSPPKLDLGEEKLSEDQNVSIESEMKVNELTDYPVKEELSSVDNKETQSPCLTSGCEENVNQRDLLEESELEDGEIVDSSDESVPEKEEESVTVTRRKMEFVVRKIKRRNTSEQITWSRRKFSKAKSCPPEITFADIPVEEIPLPIGPPPRESCWEAKENPSISRRVDSPCCHSPFGLNDLQHCRNPSPPASESSVFPGTSKIRFSIFKQNKFSKQSSPPEKVPTPECEEVPNMKPVELSEDLENIGSVDRVTESYECEDIPTSEDLTNGDDPESEKVNDDKFRNIMQNCLENAKKFLNCGNLKLFSCSVDDLLELEPETEKPTNHISRDVLLTSCEDTNEDLGLSENIQPPDISMDFVPFDVCPEALPVDNWPYLEEEVTSSPTKPKTDDSDLLAGLEKVSEKTGRKRVASETNFKKSLKISEQRRKTFDAFTEASYGKDVESELLRFKNEINKNSFKCRLSLEKLMDYKSPTWQPKVMLCRISNQRRRSSRDNHKPRTEHGTSDPVRKHKKPRFRNLYSKDEKDEEVIAQPTKQVHEDKPRTEKKKSEEIEKPTDSHSKSDHERESRHRENKKHDHRDRRREKEEGRDRKHSKSKRKSEVVENKGKHKWVCEVCGFSDETERVTHVRTHPFHCQSCHLAFKTETHFVGHLTKKHKDIRNQHHCLLCELSFDTEDQYQRHLETREHTHLESVEKNTINTLFTLLTGAPCPVLGLVEMKPEWLPSQAGTVHFYHQATPLSLALQYLKMSNLKSS